MSENDFISNINFIDPAPKSTATKEVTLEAKIFMVIQTQVNATEKIQDELFGLIVKKVAYDKETRIFTISAHLPKPTFIMSDKPESGWFQIATKQDGPHVISRKTDMAAGLK